MGIVVVGLMPDGVDHAVEEAGEQLKLVRAEVMIAGKTARCSLTKSYRDVVIRYHSIPSVRPLAGHCHRYCRRYCRYCLRHRRRYHRHKL